MLSLPASELAVLQPGRSPDPSRAGNIGVIAAGTGLGEAMLYWDGTRYHPIASEGGHADFGPRTEPEVDLWQLPPRPVRRPRQLRAGALRARVS